MHFSIVESYERYRTVFVDEDVEISVDEYPFGLALEVENKSTTKDPETIVREWVSRIGLDMRNAYRLSWDDMYASLCEEQNIPRSSIVKFGTEMPSVRKK